MRGGRRGGRRDPAPRTLQPPRGSTVPRRDVPPLWRTVCCAGTPRHATSRAWDGRNVPRRNGSPARGLNVARGARGEARAPGSRPSADASAATRFNGSATERSTRGTARLLRRNARPRDKRRTGRPKRLATERLNRQRAERCAPGGECQVAADPAPRTFQPPRGSTVPRRDVSPLWRTVCRTGTPRHATNGARDG